MNRALLFALAAVALAPTALAKKPPAPAPAPPTMAAEAPEQVRALQPFLGKFTGTGTLHLGEQAFPLTATWDCTVGSGGYAVRCQMDGAAEGLGPHYESDLFGWNATDGLYHWYSVVNSGEVHDHYGSIDGNVWTFQQMGSMNGHLFTERNTITIEGATITIESKQTLGNALQAVFEGTFTRQ